MAKGRAARCNTRHKIGWGKMPLFSRVAVPEGLLCFLFSAIWEASKIWALRCIFGISGGVRRATCLSSSWALDRFLIPAVPPLKECNSSSSDLRVTDGGTLLGGRPGRALSYKLNTPATLCKYRAERFHHQRRVAGFSRFMPFRCSLVRGLVP